MLLPPIFDTFGKALSFVVATALNFPSWDDEDDEEVLTAGEEDVEEEEFVVRPETPPPPLPVEFPFDRFVDCCCC